MRDSCPIRRIWLIDVSQVCRWALFAFVVLAVDPISGFCIEYKRAIPDPHGCQDQSIEHCFNNCRGNRHSNWPI